MERQERVTFIFNFWMSFVAIFASTASCASFAQAVSQPKLTYLSSWSNAGGTVEAIGDFNGNGKDELLVRSRSNGSQVSLVEANDSVRGYRVLKRFSSPYEGSGNHRFSASLDVTGDGRPEILLVRSSPASIVAIDGVTHEALKTAVFGPGVGWIDGIAFGDVNGDGIPELLAFNPLGLFVIDAATFQEIGHVYVKFEWNTRRSVIADVTNDSTNELILGSGQVYRITQSGNVWSAEELNGFSPGSQIIAMHAMDSDNDGKNEIYTAEYYGGIKAYRMSPPSTRIDIVPAELVNSAYFYDIDGDGIADVIGSFGVSTIEAFSLPLGHSIWMDSRNHDRLAPVRAGDFSGDGTPEIVLSPLVTIYGESLFIEPVLKNSSSSWYTLASGGPAGDPVHYVGSDGYHRIAVLTGMVSTGDQVNTFENWHPATFEELSGSSDAWLPSAPVWPIRTFQNAMVPAADPLRPMEALILVGYEFSEVDGFRQSRFWAMGEDGELLRTIDIGSSLYLVAAKRASILADATPQIIALGATYPGDTQGRLLILSSEDGRVLWESAPLAPPISSLNQTLQLGDLDGDGHDEVLVSHGSSSVTVFSPRHGTSPVVSFTDVIDTSVFKRAGVDRDELALLRVGGWVEFYSSITTVPASSMYLGSDALTVAAFEQPGSGEIFVVSQRTSRLSLYSSLGALIDSFYIGYGHSIRVQDSDRDNQVELMLSGGRHTFRVSNDYIFEDGMDASSANSR